MKDTGPSASRTTASEDDYNRWFCTRVNGETATLQQWSNSLGAGELLHRLIANIAGVEIGKDQYIGAPGDLTLSTGLRRVHTLWPRAHQSRPAH